MQFMSPSPILNTVIMCGEKCQVFFNRLFYSTTWICTFQYISRVNFICSSTVLFYMTFQSSNTKFVYYSTDLIVIFSEFFLNMYFIAEFGGRWITLVILVKTFKIQMFLKQIKHNVFIMIARWVAPKLVPTLSLAVKKNTVIQLTTR